jgi:hypothetical protein
VPVGEPVSTVEDGRKILQRLAAGDVSALGDIGVKVPEGFDPQTCEWGLGRTADGELIIVKGAADRIDPNQLPGVELLEHTHPFNDDSSKGYANALTGDGSVAAMFEPQNYTDRVHFFPSPADIQYCAQNGIDGHLVHTPFVVTGEGTIGNPTTGANQQGVTWEIQNPEYAGRLRIDPNTPVYVSELIARDADGKVIWQGEVFTSEVKVGPKNGRGPVIETNQDLVGIVPGPEPAATKGAIHAGSMDDLVGRAQSYGSKSEVQGEVPPGMPDEGRYLNTNNIRPEDLPYKSEIRDPVSGNPQLPKDLSEIPTVDVKNVTDIRLVGDEHSGSGAVIRLAELADGNPVVLKSTNAAYAAREAPSAQLLSDLGIGPEFHGIFRDPEGRINLVIDVVPGDFAKTPVLPESFSDLETMLSRLEAAGVERLGDFQVYRTQKGRLLVIDPGGIAEFRGQKAAGGTQAQGSDYNRQRASLILAAPSETGISYLERLRAAQPDVWKGLCATLDEPNSYYQKNLAEAYREYLETHRGDWEGSGGGGSTPPAGGGGGAGGVPDETTVPGVPSDEAPDTEAPMARRNPPVIESETTPSPRATPTDEQGGLRGGQVPPERRGASAVKPESQARVTEAVTGHYDNLDVEGAPHGWTVTDEEVQTNPFTGVKSVTTKFTDPEGRPGTFERAYDPATKQLTLKVALLHPDSPTWLTHDGTMMTPKGTPSQSYWTLRQMKKLGVGFGEAKSVKMAQINNVETILQLAKAQRDGTLEAFLASNRSLNYAQTPVIQSGGKMVPGSVKMSGGREQVLGDMLAPLENIAPFGEARKKQYAELMEKYGITRDTVVMTDFNLTFDLAPVGPENGPAGGAPAGGDGGGDAPAVPVDPLALERPQAPSQDAIARDEQPAAPEQVDDEQARRVGPSYDSIDSNDVGKAGDAPTPAPAAEPDRVLSPKGSREFLETAEVIGRSANAVRSANATIIVTLRGADGRVAKAIFKPAAGEASLRKNIPAGRYYKREVAASRLNDALGLDLVPETVERTIDGKVGSLQLFVEGAKMARDAGGGLLQRLAGEKFRVFDYIVGNSDRHLGNLLVRHVGGENLPVLIDNGLSFPKGGNTSEWRFPHQLVEDHPDLLPETVAFIQSIDPVKVATVMVELGISREATENVLKRLAVLKKNPSIMRQKQGNKPQPRGSKHDPATVAKDPEVPPGPDPVIDEILNRLYAAKPG